MTSEQQTIDPPKYKLTTLVLFESNAELAKRLLARYGIYFKEFSLEDWAKK